MTVVNLQGQIKLMGISEKIPRNKLCVDIIGATTTSKDRPKFNKLLKPFSLNPKAQKFYIQQNKSIMIANLVDIFYTNDYNHS